MKKNIVVLMAALCAVNGMRAIITHPTTFTNRSRTAVRISGALGQDYTVAPEGEKIEVMSLGRKIVRGDSIKLESGIQDVFTVTRVQFDANQKKFVPVAGGKSTYRFILGGVKGHFDFKGHFNWVENVFFVGKNGTLTLQGVLKTHYDDKKPAPNKPQNFVRDGGMYGWFLDKHCPQPHPKETQEEINSRCVSTMAPSLPKARVTGIQATK